MFRLIKWVLILLLIAAAGWSGWWYLGAVGQEQGIASWLEKQRERGWQAEAAEISVQGYPLDFNMVAKDIELADPRNGWAWTAPELLAASAAHSPTRIAVTWPLEQNASVPGDRVAINATKMETLLDVRPGPSMELRQAATQIASLRMAAQTGWTASAESVDFDLAERDDELGPAHSYALDLDAIKLVLPKQIVARIDPTGWLKPKIDRLTFQGHGAFDAPLDRKTIENGFAALRAATIREAGFEWGDMRLVVRGAFDVNAAGFPDGEIEVEAGEWREMIRLAIRSGMIDVSTGETITQGVELLTGGGDELQLTLGLSGGKVKLGPFAIADAPRLSPPQ
ncbi:MAG: DUF2125 domain-containing protein [Pseudomonadota bacterium]